MPNRAQLEVRLSEIREQVNTQEEPDQIEALVAEYRDTEKQLRLAIQKEEILQQSYQNAMANKPETSEERELVGIQNRALVSNYLVSILDQKEVQGAERELRAAMYGDRDPSIRGWEKDKSIPLSLLLSDPNLEARADAATVITANEANVTTHEILARIFARTDSAFLGAQFPSVPAGTQRYPYVSAGASFNVRDEGVDIDSQALGVTTETSDPREGTCSYLVGNTSMLRFNPGVLEAAIRRDATDAITSGLDDVALMGVNAQSNVRAVLNGLYDDLTLPSADPSATITTATFLTAVAGRVDGTYAYTSADVRVLLRPEVFRILEYGQVGTSDTLMTNLMSGRWRASNRLPAPGAGSLTAGISPMILYAPMNDMGEWKVPIWEDVQVIVDPYSRADRGQTRFTFAMAFNVVVLRNNPWTLVKAKST